MKVALTHVGTVGPVLIAKTHFLLMAPRTHLSMPMKFKNFYGFKILSSLSLH